MIDLATLVLTHGLMMVALLRLLSRGDLDHEDEALARRKPWHQPPGEGAE